MNEKLFNNLKSALEHVFNDFWKVDKWGNPLK
jgi:hypothetical protein